MSKTIDQQIEGMRRSAATQAIFQRTFQTTCATDSRKGLETTLDRFFRYAFQHTLRGLHLDNPRNHSAAFFATDFGEFLRERRGCPEHCAGYWRNHIAALMRHTSQFPAMKQVAEIRGLIVDIDDSVVLATALRGYLMAMNALLEKGRDHLLLQRNGRDAVTQIARADDLRNVYSAFTAHPHLHRFPMRRHTPDLKSIDGPFEAMAKVAIHHQSPHIEEATAHYIANAIDVVIKHIETSLLPQTEKLKDAAGPMVPPPNPDLLFDAIFFDPPILREEKQMLQDMLDVVEQVVRHSLAVTSRRTTAVEQTINEALMDGSLLPKVENEIDADPSVEALLYRSKLILEGSKAERITAPTAQELYNDLHRMVDNIITKGVEQYRLTEPELLKAMLHSTPGLNASYTLYRDRLRQDLPLLEHDILQEFFQFLSFEAGIVMPTSAQHNGQTHIAPNEIQAAWSRFQILDVIHHDIKDRLLPVQRKRWAILRQILRGLAHPTPPQGNGSSNGTPTGQKMPKTGPVHQAEPLAQAPNPSVAEQLITDTLTRNDTEALTLDPDTFNPLDINPTPFPNEIGVLPATPLRFI